MRPTKTVGTYLFGRGCVEKLNERIAPHMRGAHDRVIYFVDHYFQSDAKLRSRLPYMDRAVLRYIDTTDEITTEQIDGLKASVLNEVRDSSIRLLVGVGGGSVLDVTKAVANLLTNDGCAADYQGWDLVQNPAVYKIGVPTLSGTGAEGSATCVMLNKVKNLKLGMNSIYTVYDELILDPDLTATVSRDQYFYTGMDTYIHCVESLAGSYRHSIADSYSNQALSLARQVFHSEHMQSNDAREALMVASYLGGSAIGNSFVGVVHPFSAGLSVVFGTHHCLANCIVMNVMDEFYPNESQEFRQMLERQAVFLPRGICADATRDVFDRLYASTIIHEKPLRNALGDQFRNILTPEKVAELFSRM